MIQFIQLHHKYNKNFQTKCEKSQESLQSQLASAKLFNSSIEFNFWG